MVLKMALRKSGKDARRGRLLTSAARVIAERGLAGATLGAVASDAGMSPTAALYYYPSFGALVDDVQKQAIERFCTSRAAAIEGIRDPVKRLNMLLEGGLPTSNDDELCRLLYELGANARVDATHAVSFIILFERQVAIYMGVLEAGAATGQFKLARPSMEIAQTLVVMEDGLGLHLSNKSQSVDRAAGLALMRNYAAVATGRAAVAVPRSTPHPAAGPENENEEQQEQGDSIP